MREIIFRGKSAETPNNRWVYGWVKNPREHPIIVREDFSSWYVYPKTLGEYAGFVDNNGSKIFEDDFVKVTHPSGLQSLGVVVFEDSCFYIKQKGKFLMPLGICNKIEYKIEQIGNIHDNPKLLEEIQNEKS